MGVEDPGTFLVTCDRCDAEADMPAMGYAGTPQTWGVDEDTLADFDWAVVDGEVLCKECVEKAEAEEGG